MHIFPTKLHIAVHLLNPVFYLKIFQKQQVKVDSKVPIHGKVPASHELKTPQRI